MIIEGDVSTGVAPVLIIGRGGSGSGLATHALSIQATIGRAVPLVFLPIDDPSTYSTVRSLGVSVGGVVATESPVGYPDLVAALAQIGGRVRRALVYAWDSDEPDPQEVLAINAAFDHVWTVARPNDKFAARFSEHIEWRRFPLSLDMKWPTALSMGRARHWPRRLKVTSVGAFHPRKQHDVLIDAVAALVEDGYDLELLIHSNLDQGTYLDTVKYAQEKLPAEQFFVTNDDKDLKSLALLYSVSDLYVTASRGESYNIPLRQAIAAGIPSIAFDIPGHTDLEGLEGVDLVVANTAVPASYPERDNHVCGSQWTGTAGDLATAMAERIDTLRAGLHPDPKSMAGEGLRWDHRLRRHEMWTLFVDSGLVRSPAHNWLPPTGRQQRQSQSPRPVILPAFDAGLLANFNVLASHLAWWPRTRWLPDWSVAGVRQYSREPLMSFCYARPQDGNLIPVLFEYPDSLEDLEALAEDSRTTVVVRSYNAMLDPYLTYIHPEKLYRSAEFRSWRQRMHDVLREYLWPRPDLISRVDELVGSRRESPLLGVHIRHPSHAIEQPENALPSLDDYVGWAAQWLVEHDGSIFVATDQEQVIDRFVSEFGARTFYQKAARESIEISREWLSLDEQEKFVEGHQFQHQMTRDAENHSPQLAVEVLADVWALARCDYLVHSVSNVATAAAMVNPELRLLYARPGLKFNDMQDLAALTEWFPAC